jgi:hypothetical protein
MEVEKEFAPILAELQKAHDAEVAEIQSYRDEVCMYDLFIVIPALYVLCYTYMLISLQKEFPKMPMLN